MTGETVLIAAFSGRSLAQSARRAGYRPLVVDAFGDLDMRDAAADFRVIDGAMQTGFKTKPLISALDDLSRAAPSPPIGIVLGSGFEDKPRLWDVLDKRYHVLGCNADTVRKCKDPRHFFSLLDDLDIPHPEWRSVPPDRPEGWISKRIGGSGGRHIRDCAGTHGPRPRRYFQRKLTGERLSISANFASGFLPSGGSTLFALTRQWISPSTRHPYRFGGCVSMPEIEVRLHVELASIAERVGAKLGLVGMASFDFIVVDELANLLEVNPRPGASLDVIDDDDGHAFKAHIASRNGTSITNRTPSLKSARVAAILHADRSSITVNQVVWPEWSADTTPPGTFVPQDAPLATVFAEGKTATAAQALARARLAELEDLIYGHALSH